MLSWHWDFWELLLNGIKFSQLFKIYKMVDECPNPLYNSLSRLMQSDDNGKAADSCDWYQKTLPYCNCRILKEIYSSLYSLKIPTSHALLLAHIEVINIVLFRDLLQLVKAFEQTRNKNVMLHYVRVACLVCLSRNNQEKLYMIRDRCLCLSRHLNSF